MIVVSLFLLLLASYGIAAHDPFEMFWSWGLFARAARLLLYFVGCAVIAHELGLTVSSAIAFVTLAVAIGLCLPEGSS